MYTIDEFIDQLIKRGYASRNKKKLIREWCEKQQKSTLRTMTLSRSIVYMISLLSVNTFNRTNGITPWMVISRLRIMIMNVKEGSV